VKLVSTNHSDQIFTLKEAVLLGLAPDRGLFMPTSIPSMPPSFFEDMKNMHFSEIAYEVCKTLIGEALPDNHIERIINASIDFPAPLIVLDDHFAILELFHGPSLAFKDFGARFMAQLMSYYNQGETDDLLILVATSGDTGGAVAAGFHNVPGIQVVILYPRGKVSDLQKKQLTTFGANIHTLEVSGTFDDCQNLVKQAFVDEKLRSSVRLSSANSINIARLIPQSFYYFEAYKQIPVSNRPIAFSVPSGNFGNLTAGLIAKKMGLPIDKFIAATNINNIVPNYLTSGVYSPKKSVETISNAMDVGNPSNFDRMDQLYCSTWNDIKKDLDGFWFTDNQTRTMMRNIYKKYQYTIDPHGAVGFLGATTFHKKHPSFFNIVLETAHPGKFQNIIEDTLNAPFDLPVELKKVLHKTSSYRNIETDYSIFRNYILDSF
jgi:threonine synthase